MASFLCGGLAMGKPKLDFGRTLYCSFVTSAGFKENKQLDAFTPKLFGATDVPEDEIPGVTHKLDNLVVDGQDVKVLFDTVEEYDMDSRFRASTMDGDYSRSADMQFFVYDVSDKTTFDHVQNVFYEGLTSSHQPRVKTIIAGQTDPHVRQVTTEQGEDFFNEYKGNNLFRVLFFDLSGDEFMEGRPVELHSIESRKELNGLRGNLGRELKKAGMIGAGRWQVHIDKEQDMAPQARDFCEGLEMKYQASFAANKLRIIKPKVKARRRSSIFMRHNSQEALMATIDKVLESNGWKLSAEERLLIERQKEKRKRQTETMDNCSIS